MRRKDRMMQVGQKVRFTSKRNEDWHKNQVGTIYMVLSSGNIYIVQIDGPKGEDLLWVKASEIEPDNQLTLF